MIRQIAFDDKTGKQIEGVVYKLRLYAVNADEFGDEIEDMITDDLGYVDRYDFSEETILDVVGCLDKYIRGEKDLAVKLIEDENNSLKQRLSDADEVFKKQIDAMAEELEASKKEVEFLKIQIKEFEKMKPEKIEPYTSAEDLRAITEAPVEKRRGRKPKSDKSAIDAKYESMQIDDMEKFVTLVNAGWDVEKLSVEFFRSKSVIQMNIDQLFAEGRVK